MARLTDLEKETIICFSEGSRKATIFTYNLKWQKQLGEVLGLKPIMTNHFGGKEYEIDKKRIVLPRKPKTLTAAQRKEIGSRLHPKKVAKTRPAVPRVTTVKKVKTTKKK